jgi:hypothetical protein
MNSFITIKRIHLFCTAKIYEFICYMISLVNEFIYLKTKKSSMDLNHVPTIYRRIRGLIKWREHFLLNSFWSKFSLYKIKKRIPIFL